MAEENKGNKVKDKKKQKKKNSFWKGLKAEFSKITWTDRKTLGKQTGAVVVISAVVCVMITLIDSLGLQMMELLMR